MSSKEAPADNEGVLLLRDVMSTNVVNIPSKTPVTEARKIMEAHRVRHLPVVDKGKLVGLITRDTLDKTGPSQLTTFSMHEISYLLSSIKVADVMKKDLAVLPPTATVEEAVALARRRRVDSILVVDKGHLLGIATSNDFFDKVANPILGIDKPGVRLTVRDCCRQALDLVKVMTIIGRFEGTIISIGSAPRPETDKLDLIVHLDSPNVAYIVESLKAAGYQVQERAR